MNITEVVNKYNLSARTLRYYEQIGLITSSRTESNVRDYNKNQLTRLESLLILKALELSLKEIKLILDAEDAMDMTDILKDKLIDISTQIYKLTEKKQLINSVISSFGSGNITKKMIQDFFNEQLYFSKKNERLMKMAEVKEKILLEIGVGLITVATVEHIPNLLKEIKDMRKKMAEKYNKKIDIIRIKDNIDELREKEYRIVVKGCTVVRKEIETDNVGEQIEHIMTNLKAVVK